MVLGQAAYGKPQIPDIVIPVEPISAEPSQPAPEQRNIDYTEDLWSVTDQGILNDKGEYVNELPPESATDQNAAVEFPPGITSQESLDAYKQSIITASGSQRESVQERLKGVQQNLAEQQARFQELDKKISEAETNITPLQAKADTLKNEIELLNAQIESTKDKVTKVEVLIAEKQIEVKDLMLRLKRSQIELAIQQKIVVDYIRLLYGEEEQYFDLYSDSSSTLKLLLADNSVSENLLGKDYVEVMENTGRQVFYDMEKANREMAERQDDISKEQQDLQYLYNALNREKKILEENKLAKKDILADTQGQEDKYQTLLEESIQQQLETSIAIQNLQENEQMIEAKLNTLDQSSNQAQTAPTIPSTAPSVEPEETQPPEAVAPEEAVPETAVTQPAKVEKPFIWPVPPNKITAYFLDPTYPKAWGIHYAIDIEAPYGTAIRAPANAYVFQTKDNGMGYSYIILAHKGNLVTVYGHVSEIIAQAGTIVKKGQIIGLTGGTPGTKGAGLQTTGPHLHFEVHYKGQPVNPLDYLPLDQLPIEYVPDSYLKQLKQ